MYSLVHVQNLESLFSNMLSSSLDWISIHENFHESSQMSNTFNWHCVVHGNSDSWAEGMTLDLSNAYFLRFNHKFFFKIGVSTLDSKDDVDSTSPFLLNDVG